MSTQAKDGGWSLTEKEKQTLRLIVRGHDAKSIARSLDLSIHTVNERLRDARRKMAVSSSREAARLLLEVEGGDPVPATPNSLGYTQIGDDPHVAGEDHGEAPGRGVGRALRHPRILIGVALMTLVFALLALTAVPQPVAAPSSPILRTAPDAEVVDAARQWLVLLDQGRWDASYQATGTAFQKLNTLQVWTNASERVRVPLGAMVSRTFLSQENLPAPPSGYEVVKFKTRFANKAEAIETVTLERESGAWRVVGVTVG